jgi:2-methylisocitrate lyase-like PEP mutase family enzyme
MWASIDVVHPSKYLLMSTQTGAGTTASRLGMADLGIAQLHDMREHAEMIANLDPRRTPLIADMDTGYGGASSTSTLSVISTFLPPVTACHDPC